jgi:hypothetical protein
MFILLIRINLYVCILLGYYRRDHQGQGLEEREQASLRAQQRELERSIEIRHIERQHSLSSPLLSPKIEKKIRRKSREKKGRGVGDDRQKAYNTELDDFQENLRQDVMDTVNHSIQEMNAQLGASFGVHSAQLREGFENLSESILERSRIQTSPNRGGTSPSGSRSRSMNNSIEINNDIPQSDFLGQTHGRSRGSLVHPGGSGGGENLFRDVNEGRNGGYRESSGGNMSGGAATWQSPNKVYSDGNNDRKDHNNINKNTEYSPQNGRYSPSPNHEGGDLLSEEEMAVLIRDRLRKKLKDVLRPNS